MKNGLFNKQKVHKVKAKNKITFMIIPDPTKSAKVVKIPKWLRYPILLLFITIVAGGLFTVQYIEELKCQVAVDRLDIQTGRYTIEDKDKEIDQLNEINSTRYEQLEQLQALSLELEEKLEDIEVFKEFLDEKVNSTEKTTNIQPSEAIVITEAEEIVDIGTKASIMNTYIKSSASDDFDREFAALASALSEAIQTVEEVEGIYNSYDEQLDILIPFWEAYPSGYPTNNTKITSNFGWRRHPVTYRYTEHTGTDFKAYYEEVYATGGGVVKSSKYETGYGYTVVIDHGYGLESKYAHNSKLYVKAGDVVERGDIIAKSGNSGVSTGPHVHYEIMLYGEFQDAMDYIKDEEL